MKYAYFPGCSAESTARDLYRSTLAVARALGIEFAEPEAWTCCGTTMAHQVDHDLSLSLAAANLAEGEGDGARHGGQLRLLLQPDEDRQP